MGTLIVYYSRTGNTERLARKLARRCGADLERIRDDGVERAGLSGYLRSAWQAWSGAKPAVRKAQRNPGDYDLVVIGTPVWCWSLAAPVRTYVSRHARQFKQVAFFCTEGGSGDDRAFAELERLCGKAPLATLTVKEDSFDEPVQAQPLRRFLARLAD